MNHPLGSSRTVVKARHALFAPDGIVPSVLPGWTGCTPYILISPALGARFSQVHVIFEKGGTGGGVTAETEMFVYVLEGKFAVASGKTKRSLGAGHYAYLPPGTAYEFTGELKGSRLMYFQKTYAPVGGEPSPGAIIGRSKDVKGAPFLGDPRAMLQVLLPETPAFDMAVNIFTYETGAALPFVETHIMEHGLLMLGGAGVYRLENEWYPVQEGDVIWMAPYCPQWFVALGTTSASYIYYKDVNRSPL